MGTTIPTTSSLPQSPTSLIKVLFLGFEGCSMVGVGRFVEHFEFTLLGLRAIILLHFPFPLSLFKDHCLTSDTDARLSGLIVIILHMVELLQEVLIGFALLAFFSALDNH
ncbi:hypothetical protein Tco_0677513 [Tanacetum coccineum]|uniref:Uncharacterized protein n=1 Tax=Tanacetum coccineum TaxID=301880 RepID=A0ABQ4XCF2_9ASTR